MASHVSSWLDGIVVLLLTTTSFMQNQIQHIHLLKVVSASQKIQYIYSRDHRSSHRRPNSYYWAQAKWRKSFGPSRYPAYRDFGSLQSWTHTGEGCPCKSSWCLWRVRSNSRHLAHHLSQVSQWHRKEDATASENIYCGARERFCRHRKRSSRMGHKILHRGREPRLGFQQHGKWKLELSRLNHESQERVEGLITMWYSQHSLSEIPSNFLL